jgi:hypothetical protein
MPFIRELLEEAVQEPATVLDPRGRSDLIADVGGHHFVIEVKCSSRSASVASAISQLESNRARASLLRSCSPRSQIFKTGRSDVGTAHLAGRVKGQAMDTFSIDRLIQAGLFRFPIAADYRISGKRLGCLELPRLGGRLREFGGRSRKRSQEILILAAALGALDIPEVMIDDGDGTSERPDFRAHARGIGEVDVEVTQLRSESSAMVVAACERLCKRLREAIAADAALSRECAKAVVSFQPFPTALSARQADSVVLAVLSGLRGAFREGAEFLPMPEGFLHVHRVGDGLGEVIVSPHLPRYGVPTDIQALALINGKREAASKYVRKDVPLWLVVGVTADFGQLEVTIDVAGRITEVSPFAQVVVADNSRALVVRPVRKAYESGG